VTNKILTIDQRKALKQKKFKAYYKMLELYPTVLKLREELDKWEKHWNKYKKMYEDSDKKIAFSNHYEELAKNKHKPMKKAKKMEVNIEKLSEGEVNNLIAKLQDRFGVNPLTNVLE